MKFRTFLHEYHEGALVSFESGPRRELTLEVQLAPIFNPRALSARVRFTGIDNYNEVVSFFDSIAKSRKDDEPIAEIIGLKYLAEGSNWVLVDLSQYGDITIKSKHVTEL